MRSHYRLYRLFLHLYPKEFRQEYAAQMIQTLDDMLDAEEDWAGRTAVWIRTSVELPISAVQENITNVGENGMSKLIKTSNKKLVAGGILVVAFIAVFALHNWFRTWVVPQTVGLFYSHSVQEMTHTQNKALATPLGNISSSTPSEKIQCQTLQSHFVSTEVGCTTTLEGYVKLGQSPAEKAAVLAKTAAVEQALKANGYTGGTNGVTLTGLVSGTYEGKDYTPDAFYQVVRNGYNCVFDTQIAYANPAQPAIHLSLSCNKTVNILGTPPNEAYNSSKGFM